MGYLIRMSLILFSTFLLSACTQNLPQVLEQRDNKNVRTDLRNLIGTLQLSTGESLPLEQINKNAVLFFVSELCETCIKEVEEMVAHFKKSGGLPLNVELYSVLIGAPREDAAAWKNTHGVTWQVGYDDHEQLLFFRLYFSALVTPSIVIYNYERQRVFAVQSPLSIEQIQQETGPWVYAP